jgi:transcriptional regulator with XRE-family HTH domain
MAWRVLEEGWSLSGCAVAGESLEDRSAGPWRSPNATPEGLVRAIGALRRQRITDAEIAELFGLALSTVSLILKADRSGQALAARAARAAERLRAPPPGRVDPHRRQEARPHRRRHPAGLRRGASLRASGRRRRVPAPSGRLLRHPGNPRRASSDRQRPRLSLSTNAEACAELGIHHLRTRAYRPRTNGKAERFSQALLRGWAYVRIQRVSKERTAARTVNRGTTTPGGHTAPWRNRPPATRFSELTGTNLIGNYN